MKPLRYSQQKIEEEDIAAVVRVMRSPYLTQGPEVEAFEAELAAYVGAKYAICVGSGTAALHLAYRIQGDWEHPREVITSPLSFVATANAAHMIGVAWEVGFVDVDPATGLMPATLAAGARISKSGRDMGPRLERIVVPVHYAGRAAPIGTGQTVIEDACHALGARDFDGCSRVGSCAHSLATCFSFHPVKPITTGEGGAITTNDVSLAIRLQELRSHGRDLDGRMIALGYNYRMTEMQAALGRTQLSRIEEMRDRRCQLAGYYYGLLFRLSGISQHALFPTEIATHPCSLSHHLYPIRIPDWPNRRGPCSRRDHVRLMLQEQGIGVQVHYPPIHLQPYYSERFGYKEGDFPEAEAWGREELSLPLHSGMVEADVERVCKALKEALS